MGPYSLEISSLEELDDRLHATPVLAECFIQDLDLSSRTQALLTSHPRGAAFMGCHFEPPAEAYLRAHGALLFPRLPELPFDPYRSRLYTAADLYDSVIAGADYVQSQDALIYAWSRARAHPPTLSETLAADLHDHAIAVGLNQTLGKVDRGSVIGVMGGHALRRDSQGYAEAAWLGQRLTAAGRTLLTGGGPGAMEAANLGALLAPHPDEINQALAVLARAPEFGADVDAWARAAVEVWQRWSDADSGRSIGIPTWFYGHEPPNAFASSIAKFFSNAIREDALLRACRGGLVYLPGAAGTVQEIFQAATENYYANNPADIAPLVLVGRDYWAGQLPAWPLLHALARGRGMAKAVHLVDSVADAVRLVLDDSLV